MLSFKEYRANAIWWGVASLACDLAPVGSWTHIFGCVCGGMAIVFAGTAWQLRPSKVVA